MAEDFSVQLRLPRQIAEGDVIEVKARIKHPVSTGLSLVETAQTPFDRFVRQTGAVYVRSLEVYYDDELITTFKLNSSTSSDPLLAFMVKATKEATIRVVVTNHKAETVETSEDVTFS